jgi:hypothetical protein
VVTMGRGAGREGGPDSVRCLGASVAPKVILEPMEYVENASVGVGATWTSRAQSFGKA